MIISCITAASAMRRSSRLPGSDVKSTAIFGAKKFQFCAARPTCCPPRSDQHLLERDDKMIIITAMKVIRDVWAESLKLRLELAKRYPGVLAE